MQNTAEGLTVKSSELDAFGIKNKKDGVRRTAFNLMSYDDVSRETILSIWPRLKEYSPDVYEEVEIEAKYSGYIKRQLADIEVFKKDEKLKIRDDINYAEIGGLSNEMVAKLSRVRPATIGEASRISGVTPAAIMAILGHLKNREEKEWLVFRPAKSRGNMGTGYRISAIPPLPLPLEKEYRFHTRGVAAAAEKIAARIPGMNGEKAYVLGLLHDYGKRIGEREENKFHGQEGYEQMMFLGYPDVAQICLTHTFPDKNFDRGQYSFPDEWIEWAREKLAGTVYTDYDYLIAFCDKLFEACEMVSIEKELRRSLNDTV